MGTRSLRSLYSCLLAGAALASLSGAVFAAASEGEANRAASEKESKALVQRVIAACPAAKAMLRASQGFATFTGVGAGTGGIGVGRPTSTRQPVYIRFDDSGAAAAGSKRDLIFLFATRDGFSSFAVKGATLGGEAAAGEAGDCSQALAPGVRVIQIEGKQVVGGAVPTARYSQGTLN